MSLTFTGANWNAAQTVTVKLGTMAPDGSAWHNLIKQMGEEWTKTSGGKVKLKVYAGPSHPHDAQRPEVLSLG